MAQHPSPSGTGAESQLRALEVITCHLFFPLHVLCCLLFYLAKRCGDVQCSVQHNFVISEERHLEAQQATEALPVISVGNQSFLLSVLVENLLNSFAQHQQKIVTLDFTIVSSLQCCVFCSFQSNHFQPRIKDLLTLSPADVEHLGGSFTARH